MTFDRSRFVIGMEVVAADGDRIGSVKQVRDHDVLVDVRLRRDLYVPFSAFAAVDGRVATLGVPADAIDRQDWEHPSPLPQTGEAAGEGEPASIVTGIGDPAQRGTWSPAADNYDLDPAETITGGRTRPGYASPARDDAEPDRRD